jgi:hypothetical protein
MSNSILPLNLSDPDDLSHILPDLRAHTGDMEDLIPDPENARKHPPENLKIIAESLLKFGQRSPLVVNKNTNYISKGNGTYMAARMLGWSKIAWVWTSDDRNNALAYGLVDNLSSDKSVNDYPQQGAHLRELDEAHYPLSKFWSNEELVPLLRDQFEKPEITDEQFDAGLQKGRAITKISASERLTIDKAIALVRSKSKKSTTEGACLDQICGEFLANHINEIDNSVNEELEIAALDLENL